MTEPKVIGILGTDYQILFRKEEDVVLKQNDGYFDKTKKLIVIGIFGKGNMSVGDLEAHQKLVLRHQIIHAFLYESGLDICSDKAEEWAKHEEMIDWFAIQSPKIFKIYKELGLV